MRTHLAFEILTNELEGIVESMDSSELDIRGRLLLPCALDDGCQDFIRTQAEDLGFLQEKRVSGRRAKQGGIWTHDDFADETDCLEGGDFEVGILLVVDEAEKKLYEISPLIIREFDCGNGGNDLRGKIASLLQWRCEGFKSLLFDLILSVYGELKPPIRVFLLPCRVLEREEMPDEGWMGRGRGKGTYASGEGILERKACGVSDMDGSTLAAEDGGQHEHVFGLAWGWRG
jgi:hypothetical protein